MRRRCGTFTRLAFARSKRIWIIYDGKRRMSGGTFDQPPNMDNAESIKSKILQFFTAHPLLGFIGCLGSLASIIGLLFSVFPWLAAPRKDLSFCVNPVRTPIVQIARPTDVSVSYKGNPVKGNVTAAQIAIWNAGREPIKGDDVLTPIILHTGTNQIMEASILKATREVSGFQLDSNNIGSNSIGMKWRILEKNDGALLQIVYSGDVNVPVIFEGVLIGQAHLDQVTRIQTKFSSIEMIFAVFAVSLMATMQIYLVNLKAP
jgi:hypothetical protein